jgi:hypothetical protein
LAPLYERLKARALDSKVVQTDDTPVKVLDPELPKTRTGRIWLMWGLGPRCTTTPTRKREAGRFLKHYRGYLQADAYAGYDHYEKPERGLIEVGCMAHARRKYFEARTSNLPCVAPALGYIGLLYRIERTACGWSPAERLALRQRCAVPVLEELRAIRSGAAERAAEESRGHGDRIHAVELESAAPLRG